MARKKTTRTLSPPWCILLNLLWVYVGYELCRLAFLAENWTMFSNDMTWGTFWKISKGGLIFDTSAILLTNALYIFLVLLPYHHKDTPIYRSLTKWIYVVVNSFAMIANLVDSAFFPYNFQRSTAMVFKEFGNETNIGSIVGVEVVHHWYFLLLVIMLILMFIRFYIEPSGMRKDHSRGMWYLHQVVCLLFFIPIIVCGIRGGAKESLRPITISNAHQYVNQPMETGIVLNTPFSLLRTWKVKHIPTPTFFATQEELDSVYSPVHYPIKNSVKRKKNVVIIIIESFAQEFVGALNTHLDDGKYRGYTSFADSLLQHSLYYEASFANAAISIDAMPAVISSIPRMDDSFILSPYSLNKTNSLASELKTLGYYTAFFHGADNNSMGFQAFARAAGFEDYFGRTEYDEDPRFNGEKDFDGTWAIWDEPFLQFFCLEMSEMKEPFFTSVFTASSHHPFAIPDEYKDIFKDEGLHKIHKCIRYTDNALRHFFATAKQQPWYNNTIFVITADHASAKTTHGEYKTTLGHFKIPIFFFDPSGEMPFGKHPGISQQLDIMPTILGYLGYDKPYVAFGIDLLNTPPEDTWAFNWDHLPQFVQGSYLLQMHDEKITGMYDYRTDTLLKHNLIGTSAEQKSIELNMKAFIQSVITRMKNDDMVVNP